MMVGKVLFVVAFGLFVTSAAIQVRPAGLSPLPPPSFLNGYHDYDQMTTFLSDIAENYSDFATLYSIGRSVEERELWVLKIRSPERMVLGAPHIKFIGNIHGNEPVGRELILHLAEHLVRSYETDPEVKWILDRTVIHLLPSLNPDGFEKSKEGDCYWGPGRGNGNAVDLNRSFPDHFRKNRIPVQPETSAIAEWMSKVPFVLSASFHGGALVANYPFDSNPSSDAELLKEEIVRKLKNGTHLVDLWNSLTPNERELVMPQAALTPDDDVFRHLAKTYSGNHLTMHKGRTCNEHQPSFPGGITNGAAWYSFTGGMQDYNYVTKGCMELTLEISCCKYPQAQNLPRLWAENKKAMLELAKQAQMGVRGLVVDGISSKYIPGAHLHIAGRNVSFTSSKNGEFWRMLLPGDYILTANAKGYKSQSFPFTVESFNASYPTSTWLNVYLQPAEDLSSEETSNIEQATGNAGSSPYFPSTFFFWFFIFGLLLKDRRFL